MFPVTDPLTELTAVIVSAYVSKNSVPVSALSEVVTTVHGALSGLGQATPVGGIHASLPTPAQVRKSVQPDAIVSFLDGRSYKSMKRHLRAHGLTPEGYRQRFGLPADYPMVAPAYGARRSEIARSIMLGGPAKRAQLQAAE